MAKANIDNELKNLNNKINSDKTIDLLVQNELKRLQTFNSIYFCGKSHYENDGTQNCLEFQLIHRYFKTVSITNDHVL